MKFHRILVLADPEFGSASLSSQTAIALEDAGHAVTFMTPQQSPWLFEPAPAVHAGAGIANPTAASTSTAPNARTTFRVRESLLKPFLEKSRPSLVLLFDGIVITDADLKAAEDRKVIIVNAGPNPDADIMSNAESTARPDAGQDTDQASNTTADSMLEPIETNLYQARFAPAFAKSHRTTQLANFIACKLCAVCCDASSERSIAAARALRDTLGQEDSPVRIGGVGAGWPDDLRIECGAESLVYAARNAAACVSFGTERELTVCSACLEEGAPLIQANPNSPESIRAAAASIRKACQSTPRPTEWKSPETTREPLLRTPSLDNQTARLIEALENAGKLADGFDEPAKSVCLCGYYGVGNFGDEMIAEHLAQSLQRKHGLVNVRAICAIAPKAWELHGIETMEMGDHAHVARAVQGSQALLITAGLLFDQGIRWTPGLATLLAPTTATDLPGLAHLCVLAQACGTPAFFYGTGDGPLNVEASRRCMRIAGQAGARFFARNAHSERLLLDCGVPAENVVFAADTLFELETPDQRPARAWAHEHGADLDERIVTVALRDWPGLPQDWTSAIARQFDRMAEAFGCTFLFMEFDPEDAAVHDAVTESMQRQDAILRYGAIADYEEALSLLGAAWGGFAMRLHCSLIMACFGKPCVGIGYLPKVKALFTELGLGDLLTPLSFTEAQLEKALDTLAKDHGRLCEEANRAVSREKSRLKIATRAVDEALAAPPEQVERRYWCAERTLFEDMRAHQANLEGCLAHSNARIADLEAALHEANARAAALESSHSYRLGHALMKVPHAIKAVLHK